MKSLSLIVLIICGVLNPVFAQWKTVTGYPGGATDGVIGISTDQKAYFGGGLSNHQLYSFDPVTKDWDTVTQIPGNGHHRAWAYGFFINGKIYIGGGSYQGTSDLYKDLWAYDLTTDTWVQKKDFPGGKWDGAASFSIGNKGYVCGGFDGTYLKREFYEYDPSTDTWKQLTHFPGGPTIFPSAFVINGKAYVGLGGNGGSEINAFGVYDPENGQWTKKIDFPGTPRQSAVAFAINGKGYVGGGMAGYDTTFRDFWSYDPVGDEWEKLDFELPSGQTAWSSGAAVGDYGLFGTGTTLPDFNFSSGFYQYKFNQSSTGIASGTRSNQKMKIYPNPAQKFIFIKGDNLQKVEVVEMHGKVVLEKNAQSDKVKINYGVWKKGVYFINIYLNNSKVTRRMIKE